jgi:integrase
MRTDNPVHGTIRFADGKRERRLIDGEYKMFGEALRNAADARVWPPALAAARYLALTGWRSGEVLGLRWTEIDLARRTATLGDTKTGRSIRPLSIAACDVLRGLPRSSDLAFPASRGAGRMTGLPKFWARIVNLGDLSADVTPHVLRHSFASLASDLGYSEPTIAALVGHKGRTMTSRYVHSADAVLLSAADAVADRIAALKDAENRSVVIELESARSKEFRAR